MRPENGNPRGTKTFLLSWKNLKPSSFDSSHRQNKPSCLKHRLILKYATKTKVFLSWIWKVFKWRSFWMTQLVLLAGVPSLQVEIFIFFKFGIKSSEESKLCNLKDLIKAYNWCDFLFIYLLVLLSTLLISTLWKFSTDLESLIKTRSRKIICFSLRLVSEVHIFGNAGAVLRSNEPQVWAGAKAKQPHTHSDQR